MGTPPLPQRGFMKAGDRRTMGVMGNETLFFSAGNKAYFEMTIAPNLELVSDCPGVAGGLETREPRSQTEL